MEAGRQRRAQAPAMPLLLCGLRSMTQGLRCTVSLAELTGVPRLEGGDKIGWEPCAEELKTGSLTTYGRCL